MIKERTSIEGRTHIVGGKIVTSGPRASPSIVSLTTPDPARDVRFGAQTDDPSAGEDLSKSLENVHGPKM